jgi:hypothetical protein
MLTGPATPSTPLIHKLKSKMPAAHFASPPTQTYTGFVTVCDLLSKTLLDDTIPNFLRSIQQKNPAISTTTTTRPIQSPPDNPTKQPTSGTLMERYMDNQPHCHTCRHRQSQQPSKPLAILCRDLPSDQGNTRLWGNHNQLRTQRLEAPTVPLAVAATTSSTYNNHPQWISPHQWPSQLQKPTLPSAWNTGRSHVPLIASLQASPTVYAASVAMITSPLTIPQVSLCHYPRRP